MIAGTSLFKYLFICRHGEAEPLTLPPGMKSANDITRADWQRKLTSAGRDQIAKAASHCFDMIERNHIDFNKLVIVHSPLLRAEQSAAELSQVLEQRFVDPIQLLSERCLRSRHFTPEQSVDIAIKILEEEVESCDVVPIVVTHQPFASKWVEYLCSLSLHASDSIHFGTASIALIAFNKSSPDFADLLAINHSYS